jgi:hypothetical protein
MHFTSDPLRGSFEDGFDGFPSDSVMDISPMVIVVDKFAYWWLRITSTVWPQIFAMEILSAQVMKSRGSTQS